MGWYQGLGSQVAYAAPTTWDISTGDLVISSGGEYAVTGSTTSHTISVNTSDPVAISLDNVSIDVSATSNKNAFDSGGNVTLYLSGSNTLKSGASQPGIKVTGGEHLTVSSAPSFAGSLSASGGAFGAGPTQVSYQIPVAGNNPDYSCKGPTCTNFAQIATLGANVTSYANTGLAANTTYRYRIYAYNASGKSGCSNGAAATTRRR